MAFSEKSGIRMGWSMIMFHLIAIWGIFPIFYHSQPPQVTQVSLIRICHVYIMIKIMVIPSYTMAIWCIMMLYPIILPSFPFSCHHYLRVHWGFTHLPRGLSVLPCPPALRDRWREWSPCSLRGQLRWMRMNTSWKAYLGIGIPSGKHTKNDGKSPFLIGKST